MEPLYLPRMIPWGIRLLRALMPQCRVAVTQGLRYLNERALLAYTPLLEAAECASFFQARGSIFVYSDERTFAAAIRETGFLRSSGVQVEVLTAEQVKSLEPAVDGQISGGLFFSGNGHCVDPFALGCRFAQAIESRGGEIIAAKADKLTRSDHGWTVSTGAGAFDAANVVVAAGYQSDRLLRPLGYTMPLQSERGYHLMLPQSGVSLSRPVAVAEHGLIATPMNKGLRLAGTSEFASEKTPLNEKRADLLFEHAKQVFSDLNRSGASRWLGNRPMLPDSLPAIGRARRHPGLLYNFGHHHLGLTHAAVSASVLSDVLFGRADSFVDTKFNLSRFGKFVGMKS
ncbi:NAD(P)/FAD-dependent oxidoreductase [Pseudorhodobacter turbinis]|uniref:NAD(P)/FAD-dependent oxidoreductase n=1 Tax=Pseudorhodobacter turbinis TaxID=2500533 RepID=UPI00143D5B6D|nr:FAD-dependent oxidoreductase [Pseudorhodobacter turbinis]